MVLERHADAAAAVMRRIRTIGDFSLRRSGYTL